MSKSRVKIKVVVIAESEEDSATEDDTALLSTQDGESGKDFEADESWPVAVETSFRDDQGTVLRKQSEVDLLAHCIFCLRKTVPFGDSLSVSQEKGEREMLQVVPRAQLPSSLSSFLISFNRFLSDLQQVNGNDTPGDSLRSRGGQGVSGFNFLDLPKMCEFCAEKMETVHRLYLKLNTEMEVLGNIIAESNNKGKYSWRAHQFQSALRCSNMDRHIIDATTDLLDRLEKTCYNLLSDPASGIEDEDKRATITNAVFQGPATTFQSLDTSTTHGSYETEPNSPSNELSSHDDAGESDGSQEFLINDEGEDDNRADADYIKSEPEDSSSDNDSTSQEEATRPRRRSLRSSLKCQSSPSSNSFKVGERKSRPNRKKRPIPDNNSWSGRIKDRLAKRKKMEQDKTFSTSIDSATKKEIFKCELGGCGATFKLWGSLFNHQGPNHDPNNVCASCGKAFPTSDQLQNHKRRAQCHRWTQMCDLCKKEIPMAEIYEHVRGHVGDEYLLKCPSPHCKHVYSNTGSLRTHFRPNLRTNFRSCSKFIPNFKEYFESFRTCQVCGYKAANSSSLRMHLFRVHENVSQKNFPCPIKGCPHQFTFRQSVVCHLFEHEIIPNVQTCSQCGSAFNFEQMEEHLKEHHGAEEVFKCIHCPFLFSTREFMLDHLSEHKRKDDLYYCDICGDSLRRFFKYSNLREHYFSKHGVGRDYPCAECGHISWTQDQATLHTKEQHVEDASKKNPEPAKLDKLCDVCHAAFSTPTKLKDHKIQAHGAEPYRCRICNATFSSSSAFYRHAQKHIGVQLSEREFPCDAEGCGRIFKAKSSLRKHFSSVHLGQKHVCDLCGKSFLTTSGLDKHKTTLHLGLFKFVCEICGKSCASKEHLERHRATHSEDRPHGCHICDKKFKTKDVLGKHVKTHRKKEPRLPRPDPPSEFKCDAQGCGKIFKWRYKLSNHVSYAHLGQKKHVCELCGKMFGFAPCLRIHINSVHLGIRKFVCETCGESFSTSSLLRRHNRIHSGVRPYSCEVCGQRFRTTNVLKTHLEAHRKKGADFKPTGPMKHVRKRVERKRQATDCP